MKKKVLVLALCLFLVGLSACSAVGPYGPSLYELALERAPTVTAPDGSVRKSDVTIADVDAMQRVTTTDKTWEKRDHRSQAFSIGATLTDATFGLAPAGIGLFIDASPIGPIVGAAKTILSTVVKLVDPEQRIEAYATGRDMLAAAKDHYLEAQKGVVSATQLTDPGRALAKKNDCAIRVVEDAVSRRVPKVTELICATGK